MEAGVRGRDKNEEPARQGQAFKGVQYVSDAQKINLFQKAALTWQHC